MNTCMHAHTHTCRQVLPVHFFEVSLTSPSAPETGIDSGLRTFPWPSGLVQEWAWWDGYGYLPSDLWIHFPPFSPLLCPKTLAGRDLIGELRYRLASATHSSWTRCRPPPKAAAPGRQVLLFPDAQIINPQCMARERLLPLWFPYTLPPYLRIAP